MQGSTLSSRRTVPEEWSDRDLLAVVAVGATAVLWPIGLVLVWASGRWRLVDKLIATAIPVAGVVVSLIVLPAGERGFGLSAPAGLSLGIEIAHYAALMGAPLFAATYLGVRGGLSRRLVAGLVALAFVVLALGQLAFFLGTRLHPGGM